MSYSPPYQELFENLNGAGATCTERSEHADTWMAKVHLYARTGYGEGDYTFLHIVNGTVNGSPGSISRFESVPIR